MCRAFACGCWCFLWFWLLSLLIPVACVFPSLFGFQSLVLLVSPMLSSLGSWPRGLFNCMHFVRQGPGLNSGGWFANAMLQLANLMFWRLVTLQATTWILASLSGHVGPRKLVRQIQAFANRLSRLPPIMLPGSSALLRCEPGARRLGLHLAFCHGGLSGVAGSCGCPWPADFSARVRGCLSVCRLGFFGVVAGVVLPASAPSL